MRRSNKTGNPLRKVAATSSPAVIRKILATTDFSDESRAGVRYAMGLAAKLNAAVVLLHSIESPPRLSGVESVLLARDYSEVAMLAREKLVSLAKREGKGHVAVASSVRTGKPFHEIASAARESAADVIVIATHGYTGAKRVLLGSTAERVVRHAPCPVLTVPTRTKPKSARKTHPFEVKRILVPIDFSELSKGALTWATFLGARMDAELVLLHVAERLPIDSLLGGEVLNHTIVPLMAQAEAELEHIAASLGKSTGPNISSMVREGRPFEQICRTAQTVGADLIIMTTHGYTGLKHVWLGSTTERVVRHAHCPVLAVQEAKKSTP